MAARRPTTGVHRAWDGSFEKLNGLKPADDQEWTHVEVNDHTDALTNHADLLDRVELKWYAGFTLSHTWVVGEGGVKMSYHSHADATPAQLAVTVPGTNGSVWVLSSETETDFVASYNAAKT